MRSQTTELARKAFVWGTWVVGAAVLIQFLLAGLGVGFWRNKEEIRQTWQAGGRFTPSMDLATREKSWNAFRTDPDWKKLSTAPGYTDAEIVVDIENQILAPTGYSQI